MSFMSGTTVVGLSRFASSLPPGHFDMNSHRRLVLLLLASWLSACTTASDQATVLWFSEEEPGGSPYEIRMVVSERYLRIDDGPEGGGYVLVDRGENTVFSVNPLDQRVLVVKPLPLAIAAPAGFEHRAEKINERLPSIDGKTVVRYRLFANGKPCAEVFSANGLLPDAVKALRQYHQILAGEQSITESNMPTEMRSACDQADFIFAPGRFLDHGFPVRHIDRHGKRRQLVRFERDVAVQAEWFIVPANYQRYSIADMAR